MNRLDEGTRFMNRLDELRGPMPPHPHNARTIAALAANPGCARRGLMDAAGVDKGAVGPASGLPRRRSASRSSRSPAATRSRRR